MIASTYLTKSQVSQHIRGSIHISTRHVTARPLGLHRLTEHDYCKQNRTPREGSSVLDEVLCFAGPSWESAMGYAQ